MAQSQTGDVEFNRGSGDVAAKAVLSDQAVSFRFVLSLKRLSIPLDSGRPATEAAQSITLTERPRPAPVPVTPSAPLSPPAISVVFSAPAPVAPVAPVVPEPSPSAAAPDVSAEAHKSTESAPATTAASPAPGLPWELTAPEFRLENVVPTVLHAFKKPATEVAPADIPPAPAPEPAPPPSARAVVAPAELETASSGQFAGQSIPTLYTAPSTIRKPLLWKLCGGVLAAILILIPVWRLMRRPAAHSDQQARSAGTNNAQASIDSGDWVRQAAVGGDPGVKQTRQLVLYKPGMKATNGRLEFAWSTDSGDVGVVFRAKDLGNYYAVRLKLLNPRTTPTLDVEYFSVYEFIESRHIEKFLIFSKVDPIMRVRIDVFGPAFTLYLQGNPAENWTDARLTSGAIGFFEEWNQAPQVNAVRISFGERSQLFRRPSGQLPEFSTRREATGG